MPQMQKNCCHATSLLNSLMLWNILSATLLSTMNPGIPADGNNMQNAVLLPKTKPHVCNRSYTEITDMNVDLVDLIATC